MSPAHLHRSHALINIDRSLIIINFFWLASLASIIRTYYMYSYKVSKFNVQYGREGKERIPLPTFSFFLFFIIFFFFLLDKIFRKLDPPPP